MSGHGHDDADTAPDAGHTRDHESSSDDFPADEPRSPGWLPLLGGALFLAGIFAFVAMSAGSKTAEELTKDAATAAPSAAPSAAPPPAGQALAPAPRPAMVPPANHP